MTMTRALFQPSCKRFWPVIVFLPLLGAGRGLVGPTSDRAANLASAVQGAQEELLDLQGQRNNAAGGPRRRRR